MDRNEIFRALRRRWWVVVVVTLVAADLALFLGLSGDDEYRTSATVGVPQEAVTPSQISQYIVDFTGAAETDAVVQAVAGAVGLTATQVDERVEASRVGSSALVRLTYTSTDADDPLAIDVLENVRDFTLDFMFQSALATADAETSTAQADADAAQEAADVAQAARADFLEERGLERPADRLNIVRNELSNLETDQIRHLAEGRPDAAASLDPAIAARRELVAELQRDAQRFEELTTAADEAAVDLREAENRLQAARRLQTDAVPDTPLVISSLATPVDDTAAVVQRTIAIGLAALIVSSLLVVAFERWRRTRRDRRDEATADTAEADPGATAAVAERDQPTPEDPGTSPAGPAAVERPARRAKGPVREPDDVHA